MARQDLHLDDLSPEQKKAVAAGMKAGEAKIAEYLETQLIELNGWGISSYFGDGAFYNGDWLKRAAARKLESTVTSPSKPPIRSPKH